MFKESLSPARQFTSRPAAVWIALLGGLLALLIRWYFVTRAQVLAPLYDAGGWGDASEYYRYAWNLVHHGLFSGDIAGAPHPMPDSYRDPAYPAYLAIFMWATSSYEQWYAFVLLSHTLLGGATVTFAILAVRQSFPTWLLEFAAVAMAFWPHLVSISAYVLTENLTAPCCALAALAIGEASRRGSKTWTVVTGLALSAAALTNAVLAPLVFPLVLALMWKKSMPWHHLLLLVAVTLTPIIAWNIRGSLTHGATSASLRADINLVQGSWPTYHTAAQLWGRRDPVGMQTMDAISDEIAILRADRVLGLKVMADRMSKTPWAYAMWYLRKPALLWGWEIGLGSGDIYAYPTRNSPYITNPFMRVTEAIAYTLNGILALAALAGLLLVILDRHPSTELLLCAVCCAWVTVVYWILQSDSRYSIPYRPAEISLACVAVWAAVQHARKRMHRPPGLTR